ncbi:hypothetical protein G3M48_009323 [Beauveria asiatica]|uniref:Uncharacterized protein n=1 Tax=Beauveria asiatica TaxID=1069075 RepID=A0AAW0RIV7_9HYPO
MAPTLDKAEFCGSYNFVRRRSKDGIHANVPEKMIAELTLSSRLCARVAASVMRAMGYSANSLRGGLVGLVTMLSTPQTCAKAGPEQQTSWLQLCEAQRAPAAAVEAPAANSSSELLKLQQAAVTVYNTGQLSSIGENISAKGCE